MLSPASIDQQYAEARTDDVRVLIVGAGIAGVSAAQMMRGDGRHPVVVERAEGDRRAGYMLALMPMVDALLDDLGSREAYRERSTPVGRYGLHAHTGRMLRVDSMARVLDRFGDYRGISRGELIETLSVAGCAVAFDTTVTALEETSAGAEVTLRTGDSEHRLEFDLVVVADGIGSRTRDLVLAGREVEVVDTKWGGWVVWAQEDADTDLGEELWGAGFFLGVYPVKGRLGAFLGGARADTAVGARPFVDGVRRKLTSVGPRIDNVLTAVAEDPDPYYWPLSDCRTPRWTTARTVLLGDAAAGFLPTAGIGAGMAMESAWVLTRILRHADRETMPRLLGAFEEAQRPRVEAAQDTSRRLARLMFRGGTVMATARDLAMRFVSVDAALKPIQRLLADEPDPDAIAAAALDRPGIAG